MTVENPVLNYSLRPITTGGNRTKNPSILINRIIARIQGATGLGFASDFSKNGRAIFKPITSERCPRNSTLTASKKIVFVAAYLVVPQESLCSRCRLLRAHERPAETKRNVATGHLVKNKEYLLLLPPGKVEGNASRKRPQ